MNIYKRYRFPPEFIQHTVPKTFHGVNFGASFAEVYNLFNLGAICYQLSIMPKAFHGAGSRMFRDRAFVYPKHSLYSRGKLSWEKCSGWIT